MKEIPCNACGGSVFSPVLKKASSQNEIFDVVRCDGCGLVQVNPQPSPSEVAKYYSNEYFLKRTDRGYDNYYSETMKNEISRVFRLNLQDLGLELDSLPKGRSLDIGCAAGYFVSFMKDQGWDAYGIDIAEGPTEFAKNKLGLQVIRDDFLDWDKKNREQFDLITLWASLEHLHKPKETLKKIYKHLPDGGKLVLSTCRYGILAKLLGRNWRYLNVPEHLYYFSLRGLIHLCKEIGFETSGLVTYGSGMTSRKNAGLLFKKTKAFADSFVKKTSQGDMMALYFVKGSP